jgi:hypothetical protein
MVDFSTVDPVFPDKTATAGGRRYAYTRAAVLARGRGCVEALRRHPGRWVVVVSHSGFLRAGMAGWFFANADFRVFDLVDDPADGDAWHGHGVPALRGWPETLRGGLGLSDTKRFGLGEGVPDEVRTEETQ